MISDGQRASEDYRVTIGHEISSQAIFYDSGDNFSSEDLAAQGWTTRLLSLEHGGSGLGWRVVGGNTILVDTNYDSLFVLMNDTYAVRNFLIATDVAWGDDDMIGFVFRYQDSANYYWVGYTADHHSTRNPYTHSPVDAEIPWVDNHYDEWVFGKMVNNVSDIIVYTTTATPYMIPNTPSIFHRIVLSVNGYTFNIEQDNQEILTVTDTTFTDFGYLGLVSIAASNSQYANILIQH